MEPTTTSSPTVGVTWLGHASVVIDVGGVRLLTDPALTPRLGHLRRHRPVAPGALERVDAILVSHLHMDHLHLPSLRLLPPTVPVVAPRGSGDLLRRAGHTDVREVVEGDRLRIRGVEVLAVPAAHDHRRGPHARVRATPIGYVVGEGAGRVYFPGDTDLFDGMRDLAGVGMALLPIWGWGSSIGDGHLDPAGAARAAELLEPALVTPIHWGTYSPARPARRPPHWLDLPAERFAAELGPRFADRLRVVAPGGSVTLAA